MEGKVITAHLYVRVTLTNSLSWKHYGCLEGDDATITPRDENVLPLKPSKIRMSLFLHQIWRNVAFHHLLSNRSSAVNGCRQNESPNSWYKHHNNPQVIQTTPVHQLTSGEDKSIIHNNASYSEIVHLLLSLTSKSSHILFRAVLNCFVL